MSANTLLPQARLGNALATALIRLLTGFRYTDLFATDHPELVTGRQGGLTLAPSLSAAAPIVVEHWLSPWMALRGQVNIASVAWSTDLVIFSDAPTGLDIALFDSPAIGVVFVL